MNQLSAASAVQRIILSAFSSSLFRLCGCPNRLSHVAVSLNDILGQKRSIALLLSFLFSQGCLTVTSVASEHPLLVHL